MGQGRRISQDDAGEGGQGSLRMCALTRSERPREELLRFVASPDGTIVVDPAAKLPGRGVWVTAAADAIAEAMRAKVFGRSLKREVKVPADLAEQAGQALERRALSALSLANKAGLVTVGFAQVDGLIEKGTLAVLLHAHDAAPGGSEKLDRKVRAVSRDTGRDIPVLSPFTVEQMSLAMGRLNVVHAALIKGGATEKFLAEAGRLQGYRRAISVDAGCPGLPDA